MSETRKLTSQEERWLAWYNLENKGRARCVFINDDGKWTGCTLSLNLEDGIVTLHNPRTRFKRNLWLIDEDDTWMAAYDNMELQFLYIGV